MTNLIEAMYEDFGKALTVCCEDDDDYRFVTLDLRIQI